MREPDKKPLNECEVSVRCINVLAKHGILTVGDVRRLGFHGLMRLDGVGRDALKNLRDAGILDELS